MKYNKWGSKMNVDSLTINFFDTDDCMTHRDRIVSI